MVEFDIDSLMASVGASTVAATPSPLPPPSVPPSPFGGDDGDSLDQYSQTVGVTIEKTVPDILRPWMTAHRFVLVKTIEELEAVVEKAFQTGYCALDLETEGLDNRVYTDATTGKLKTVHQIVGYCLCPDGVSGYYIPVRHKAPDSNNLDPSKVAAVIQKLCLAAQPKLTPAGMEADPLGSAAIETPGKVKIRFWHAKFDQEFLYPETGLDFWHPESFDDGMLMFFCLYTGDRDLGLKGKAKSNLYCDAPVITEEKDLMRTYEDGSDNVAIVKYVGPPNPRKHRAAYEMIEMKDLFPRGRQVRFESLHPEEAQIYGASDGICTYKLCENKDVLEFLKEQDNARTYRIEKQVVQVVRRMERNRVKLDKPYVQQLFAQATQEGLELQNKIVQLAVSKGFHGFDLRSSKQLGEFLFGDKGLNIVPKPDRNEKSGQYKTDADTLENLVKENPDAPEVLTWIVKFREIDKITGTYLKNMSENCDDNDEMRVQFKQTGAATGRFSAPAGDPDHGYSGVPIHGIPGTSDPNKPKVATALRKAIVARAGYLLSKCDYSGEELRIAANSSREPVWVNEFLHGKGDLHTLTARAVFGKEEITKAERQIGKCVHPDTLVFVNGTLRPISLVGKFPDQAESFAPATGKLLDAGGHREIVSLYNGGSKPLVHVVLSGGLVTCTPQHRFKLRDGRFVAAGDLRQGDELVVVGVPQIGDSPYPDLDLSLWEGIPRSRYTLSHDLAYFAGLYAGDGTGNASSAGITHGEPHKLDDFGHPYEEWVQVLERACAACEFTSSRHVGGHLYLGSRVFVKFLDNLEVHAKKSKRLRMPSWVLASGKTAILYYLGGLFDTDGTVGKVNHNLDWTTKDFVFAGQVALAMRACGLDFNAELTFNKTYQRYYIRLRLTVDSSWAMRGYMRYRGKVERLNPPQHKSQARNRFEVTRVLQAEEGPCLDVSMASEPHTYLANGFVTHNTVNFALLYGGGPMAIVRASGCTKEEGARRKQNFDKSVPTFSKWVRNLHAQVKKELGIRTPFGRWVAIPDGNSQDNQIKAACERHSVNYTIQGAGADIMKIALVLLHKEFYRRGWLQADDVRMLLTVHDEVVFEVRKGKVREILDVVKEVMERPTRMAKGGWQVPLIAEPLIDTSWTAKYDFEKVFHGRPAKPDEKPNEKDGEVLHNGRFYVPGPHWLGEDNPPVLKLEDGTLVFSDGTPPQSAPPAAPVSTPSAPSSPASFEVMSSGGVDLELSQGSASSVVGPSNLPLASPSTPPAPLSDRPGPVAVVVPGEPVTFRIFTTTRLSVSTVAGLCFMQKHIAPGGRPLHLVNAHGETLIDPSLDIRVDPDEFAYLLKHYNL